MDEITITNGTLTVSDPSPEVQKFLEESLTYVDKSAQYQLRRMSRSTWHRASLRYKNLQQQVHGKLCQKVDNKLIMSSCFIDLLRAQFPNLSVVDQRTETGSKIVVPWVNVPLPLRDYQDEALALMLERSRGLINFATGLGKTLLAVYLIQYYKRTALVVCPSESVAKQFYEMLTYYLGKQKVAFYGGGKRQVGDVTVGIAASITRHVSEFASKNLGLLIIDESHHTPAQTFADITSGLSATGKIFGLTATDYRSDGKDLMITAGCGPTIIRRDVKWGIEHGWLAEPYFIVRRVDTGGRDFPDDKLKNYREHVLNNNTMKERIREDARSMMLAKRSVLVLVDEIAHGKELSQELGVPFATGIDARSQSYLDDLNAGRIPGLVATEGKMGEGSDTRNVDVLILANFVASKGAVMQAVGRGLRKQGTKTRCLILDYVPVGSSMLSRHAMSRVRYYKEITDKVKLM